jgi:hypothetical protein
MANFRTGPEVQPQRLPLLLKLLVGDQIGF